MMKKRALIIILISLAIGILGVLFSWLLVENIYPSSISKDAWLQFFGSYIGAVVGSLVTIVSVVFTILSEREIQNREFKKRDREYLQEVRDNAKMMVMPAFSLREMHPTSEVFAYSHTYDMADYSGKVHDPNNLKPGEYGVILILKNIGLGNAFFPEIVSNERNGIEVHEKLCPENEVIEKGDGLTLKILNTLDVDENYEIAVKYRDKLPLHHEVTLLCKDIYLNEYRFIIHLNTYKKKTLLYNGDWGDFYELRLERLANTSFEEKMQQTS